MIFSYRVKHNGVYYPAGTNVPVEGAPEQVAEPVVETAPVVDEKPAAAPKTKARPKRKK